MLNETFSVIFKHLDLDHSYYFLLLFSIGSASTGSTKSATMELYTSSYNETMSGGGETLSSISEKSCISNPNNQGTGSQAFPTQAYLMVMIIFGAKIQIFLIFKSNCNSLCSHSCKRRDFLSVFQMYYILFTRF